MQQLAPSPSQWDRPRYGLVSLWDMLEIHALDFLNAVGVVTNLRRLAGENDLDKVVRFKESKGDVTDLLGGLRDSCRALGAEVTANAVDAVIDGLRAKGYTWRKVLADADHFERCLIVEIQRTKLFALSLENAKFYAEAVPMFGDAVINAFPSSAAEIDEAGKCLALGRVTATLFHLMRTIEIGLRCLATPMGIAGPKPDWGQIIRSVDDYVKLPKAQQTLPLDAGFINGVSAQMHAVKLAWRNQVMHVDTTFSLENARNIFHATKALMQHLATQLSE